MTISIHLSVKEIRKTTEKFSKMDRKQLVPWAADCAAHALHCFEDKYPKDDRPRKAILAARGWVRGKIKVGQARTAALAAHTAASAATDPAAIAAARAAGHAAATAHMAGHAVHAAAYAAKAAAYNAADKEKGWQFKRLHDTKGVIRK